MEMNTFRRVVPESPIAVLYDGTAEAVLADILHVMERHTFSRREAMEIVGGPGRLQRLCESNKVRFETKPNGRSYFTASDVLRNATVRPAKKKKKKKLRNATSAEEVPMHTDC